MAQPNTYIRYAFTKFIEDPERMAQTIIRGWKKEHPTNWHNDAAVAFLAALKQDPEFQRLRALYLLNQKQHDKASRKNATDTLGKLWNRTILYARHPEPHQLLERSQEQPLRPDALALLEELRSRL